MQAPRKSQRPALLQYPDLSGFAKLAGGSQRSCATLDQPRSRVGGHRPSTRLKHDSQGEKNMKTNQLRRLALPNLALAAMLAASPALAQDSSDEDTANDIIVTAAKRAQNLQEVPISVSAITGDALRQSRVTQAEDIVTKVPNLQLASTVGDNTPIFSLRGVSMFDFSLNQSSPVATYYDEVYKGNFALLGVALFDLERVEVLRGPQGTLYGKNTTGGAVNLISTAPKLGETSGYLNAGYGNYNRIDLNGAVNVPLGENAALRVAGTFARADGWFENLTPGQPDLASVREWGVRASLRFEPSEGMDWTLRFAHTDQSPRNYGIYAEPEAANRVGLKRRQIRSNLADERREAKTTSVALTGNIEVGDALTLTTITSYDKGRLFFFEDSDGQDVRILEVPYFARTKQFAQDLRLTSDFDGPFNFILGGYYNREKVFNSSALHILADTDSDGLPGNTAGDCNAGFPVGCVIQNSFDQLKKSFAVYSDVSFELSDALTLRGGLRYTNDKGSQTGFVSDAQGLDGSFAFNLIPPTDRRYKTNNLSGKVGLDYKFTDDNMVYGSFSRGYRARAFNAQAFFDVSELGVAKQETVNAWELGIKSQFADRRVTLNVAGFYYDYRNQQYINVDPGTGAQTLLNIPKSRILGGEIELTARASDMITLRGAVGLLDTQIKNGLVSGSNVAGNKLPNAPSFSFTGGVDLTLFDNDSGKLGASVDLSYSGSQYFETLNVPRLQQGGYALIGAHLDWESADGKWNASVWGKNLTDKFYFTSRIDLLLGFGLDYNHVGAPRSYGITVGLKF
jgi:iron complex outermembrane recepter protein